MGRVPRIAGAALGMVAIMAVMGCGSGPAAKSPVPPPLTCSSLPLAENATFSTTASTLASESPMC